MREARGNRLVRARTELAGAALTCLLVAIVTVACAWAAGWYGGLSGTALILAGCISGAVVAVAIVGWGLRTSSGLAEPVKQGSIPAVEPALRTGLRMGALMLLAALISMASWMAVVFIMLRLLDGDVTLEHVVGSAAVVQAVWFLVCGARCMQLVRQVDQAERTHQSKLLSRPLQAGRHAAAYIVAVQQ